MKFNNTTIIKTKRLVLRAINDHDRDDLIELLKNEEIGKTFMVPDFKSREHEDRMFETFKRLSNSDERFVYGIYLEGKLIGFINDVDITDLSVEVGYVIHPSESGKGYMTEALGAAMIEIFDSGFSAVKASAFEGNTASMRVMEKCGMVLSGEEESVEYRGVTHKCICYIKKAGNSHEC